MNPFENITCPACKRTAYDCTYTNPAGYPRLKFEEHHDHMSDRPHKPAKRFLDTYICQPCNAFERDLSARLHLTSFWSFSVEEIAYIIAKHNPIKPHQGYFHPTNAQLVEALDCYNTYLKRNPQELLIAQHRSPPVPTVAIVTFDSDLNLYEQAIIRIYIKNFFLDDVINANFLDRLAMNNKPFTNTINLITRKELIENTIDNLIKRNILASQNKPTVGPGPKIKWIKYNYEPFTHK